MCQQCGRKMVQSDRVVVALVMMFLTVYGGDNQQSSGCMSAGVMPLRATNDDSHLSSHVAATHEHGTARCPWQISAAPGQHVQLYVLDFSLTARYRAAVWSQPDDVADVALDYCHVYATVSEPSRAGAGDTPICASDARQTLVYTSHSNSIIVQMSSHAVDDPSANFLIRFRGTGTNVIKLFTVTTAYQPTHYTDMSVIN